MPAKFKESAQVLVNRATKKYKTVNYYMHATTTDVLLDAMNKDSTKPKRKQAIRNELVRRGEF
jgi:hypothetical protein